MFEKKPKTITHESINRLFDEQFRRPVRIESPKIIEKPVSIYKSESEPEKEIKTIEVVKDRIEIKESPKPKEKIETKENTEKKQEIRVEPSFIEEDSNKKFKADEILWVQ